MIEILIMSSGQKYFAQRALTSALKQKNTSEDFVCRIIRNPLSINRETEILKSKADWILFLDEDCYFPHCNMLEMFERRRKANPETSVWGGFYLNEEKAHYSIKAYNELCNFWVRLSHFEDFTYNLLGGCFAVNVHKVRHLLHANPISWGGEETFLLRQLQSQGIHCLLSEDLSVVHAPYRQSLRKITSRAKVHGENRDSFKLETKNYSLKAFTWALSKMHFWPVWALHFLALARAIAIQKFALEDKSLRSLNTKRGKI